MFWNGIEPTETRFGRISRSISGVLRRLAALTTGMLRTGLRHGYASGSNKEGRKSSGAGSVPREPSRG